MLPVVYKFVDADGRDVVVNGAELGPRIPATIREAVIVNGPDGVAQGVVVSMQLQVASRKTRIMTREQYERSMLPYLREDTEVDPERAARITEKIGTCCLVWTGFIHPHGYGVCLQRRAHVAYWEFHNGPIPHGKELAHRCHNKICVRHVRPLSHLENMEESHVDRCKYGHKLTPENVYSPPGRPGSRKCKKCRRAYNRKAPPPPPDPPDEEEDQHTAPAMESDE